MKGRTIGYWVAPALFCLLFSVGGTRPLLRLEMQAEVISLVVLAVSASSYHLRPASRRVVVPGRRSG